MNITPEFLEKIVLLVLTALFTGLGIPYILKRVEERKLREQKKFEADLVRQGKIIDAQSKLLDDVTQLLWQWRFLAKKVVYYGAAENTDNYEKARKEYDETVWNILDDLRTEISKSRRLASDRAYERLLEVYKYIVNDIDVEISELISGNEINRKHSGEMADRFSQEVSTKLDTALDELASELKLKVQP